MSQAVYRGFIAFAHDRTVRMVPRGWQHPVDDRGRYVPLGEHVGEFSEYADEEMPPPGDDPVVMIYLTVSEGTPLSDRQFATIEEAARFAAANHLDCWCGTTADYDWWVDALRGSMTNEWLAEFVRLGLADPDHHRTAAPTASPADPADA